MALTRAQLISGDAGQGVVLTGQVRGVKPGPGILIGTDGTITVDSQSILGVMRLGPTSVAANAAFNGYTWPTSLPGSSGRQLTVDTSGVLSWSDADGIPWTAKGQLIVGTGAGTDTLLNVGTTTAFLVADSTTASGLAWSNASTSAALLPSGTNIQRPLTGIAGQIRYNSEISRFEGYKNTTWTGFGGATGGGTDEIFYLNGQIVTTDYTLPANQNAVTAGPITVNTGITVTIPAGQAWSIV